MMMNWTTLPRASRTSATRRPKASQKITIDRPRVRNAFRPQTVKEMEAAFADARDDADVGVVILTGAGRALLRRRRSTRTRQRRLHRRRAVSRG